MKTLVVEVGAKQVIEWAIEHFKLEDMSIESREAYLVPIFAPVSVS